MDEVGLLVDILMKVGDQITSFLLLEREIITLIEEMIEIRTYSQWVI
jgi:hypothetical protein